MSGLVRLEFHEEIERLDKAYNNEAGVLVARLRGLTTLVGSQRSTQWGNGHLDALR